MACRECLERRAKMIEAALEGRIAAAAGHALKGAAEMVGLRPKATIIENEELAGQGEGIQIDAGDPPMPPVKRTRVKRS